MKKESIFTLIAMLFVATLSAQTLQTAEERAKACTDHLRTTLGLDAKQYEKTYKVYLRMMRRDDKRMEQNLADRKATEQRIKKVLSAEQVVRFEREGEKDVRFPRQKPIPDIKKMEPIRRDPRRTNMHIGRE